MPDIVTSQIFATGEKNITATKMNNIVGGSVIQPSFVSSKPVASSVNPADNLLLLTQGGTYAQVPFSTISSAGLSSVSTDAGNLATLGTDSKILVPQSAITSIRLRSFNSVGNPTFEVDQRNAGAAVGFAQPWAQDRWPIIKTGMAAASGTFGQNAAASGILLPGTNFTLTRNFLRATLTTAYPTLAAGDYLLLNQQVEGPQFRELQNDVHSIQLLVRSSVAGLSFGITLRDPGTPTRSLCKLCSIASANTWTLVTLPNLPVWSSGGAFQTAPGQVGYQLGICLAAGSSFTSPANDTWQNGNFVGAVGQGSFVAQAVNSTFDIAFIQHEPGSVCTTALDNSFVQNLTECLRYFQKTTPYTAPVSATGNGCSGIVSASASFVIALGQFQKPLAKLPSFTTYDTNNGAVNTVYNNTAGTHLGVTAINGTEKAINNIQLTSASTSGHWISMNYTCDTGW